MKNITIQIHRFRDRVALSFNGIDGETVYLTEIQATELASSLDEVLKDIDSLPFSRSKFKTKEIPASE